MKGKKILVLSLGWEQEPLVRHLAEEGALLFGVHSNEEYLRNIPFEEVQIIDVRDLQAVLTYARQVKPDAVISDQCDYSHFAQAVVANALDLPGPSIAQAQISANKLLQRNRARDAGVKVPPFSLCFQVKQIQAFADEQGYPVIVKPVDNRGSFGVNRIDGPEDVEAAFSDALINSHSRLVLVEKFIHGIHITVDGYAFPDRGPMSLALASKELEPGNRQVAMEIIYPGKLSPYLYDKTMEINETVNRVLGYDFGMLHSEYMISEEDIYLIESANRGGGVFTSELIVPAAAGIDLVAQYAADCLGKPENHYTLPEANPITLKFFRFEPGKLKDIRGLEALQNDPEVIKVMIRVGKGEEIGLITTDANRHGFLIVKGDEQRAREKAAQLEAIYYAR